MIEQLRLGVSRRPLRGAAISVAVHAVLLLALLWVPPGHAPVQKRGDTLIVELPNLQESGSLGTPGPSPDVPIPAAPVVKAPPAPPAPPARPAALPPIRPAPKAEARQAPRVVASAPQPPPSAERGDTPAAKSAPQPAPEADKTPVEASQPTAEPSRPEPAVPPAVVSPPSPGQVAMVPPSVPDIRSALRRGGGGGGIGSGGAGGTGVGRGGIEGAPIPLNSTDPDFNDYLERVRRLIQRHWVYPCVKDPDTFRCEHRSAQLVIEFGILRSGQLAFLELHKSSGYVVLDDSAANAIKLASPFPAIPPPMLKGRTGPGVPILANFHYILETDFRHVIR